MRARLFTLVLLVAGAAAADPSKPETRRLSAAELTTAVRDAIVASAPRLPKGAAVTGVRGPAAPAVPREITRAALEVTPPPRKAGAVAASAVLVLWQGDRVAARVPVTLELSVPPEALAYDVPKGSPVVLVVRKALVEVSAPAVAAVDGDVGDVIPVLLRPSGRSLRARLVSKDRAVATEDLR